LDQPPKGVDVVVRDYRDPYVVAGPAAFTGLYCGRVFWESARPELPDVVCGDGSG